MVALLNKRLFMKKSNTQAEIEEIMTEALGIANKVIVKSGMGLGLSEMIVVARAILAVKIFDQLQPPPEAPPPVDPYAR